MLKKRLAAVIVVRDGIVVQSIGFHRYLPIGKPSIAVEYLNRWGIDEIILLDISAGRNGQAPDYAMIRSAAAYCRVPLTVGGGICQIAHIQELMQCGADKVAINHAAISAPELITQAAHLYGDQCIVASIDAVQTIDGYRVYDYRRCVPLTQAPWDFAARMQVLGAGEILINSVDRDGSYQGFDLDVIGRTCAAVSVPVIACGGAGNAHHFVEIFQNTTVSAAAAANFFHFSEHSVTITKSLVSRVVPMRHETYFDYADRSFDADCRLLKQDDYELENLLYIRIEKEVI